MIVAPAPPAEALTIGASVAFATDAPTASSPAETPTTLTVACGVSVAVRLTAPAAMIGPPPEVVAETVGLMVALASAPSPARMPPAAAIDLAEASSTSSASSETPPPEVIETPESVWARVVPSSVTVVMLMPTPASPRPAPTACAPEWACERAPMATFEPPLSEAPEATPASTVGEASDVASAPAPPSRMPPCPSRPGSPPRPTAGSRRT